MIKDQFRYQVEGFLGYFPTLGQQNLIDKVFDFLQEEESVFLLRGYAGTGKSSMIGAIIRAMKLHSWQVVLLAPTGRAARVFADYAELPATTIHRKIYKQDSDYASIGYKPTHNTHAHTIFVVDEASMISNQVSEFSQSSLLGDLVEYVFEGDDCRLILVGDAAQLPPIGQDRSFALDEQVLKGFGLRVFQVELTEVIRQESGSGILAIATMLREHIDEDKCSELPQFCFNYDDVQLVSDYDIQDKLENSMRAGESDTLIITRSNWAANTFNSQIRFMILGREQEIGNGDRVVIVKNNYKWLMDYIHDDGYEHLNKMSFIANGETARIVRVRSVVSKFGCRFADATLWMEDQRVEIDALLLVDVLYLKTPSLSREEMMGLWDRIMIEEGWTLSPTAMMQVMRGHAHFNALQVKFAYAMTCHKAQGGQWNDVYIDMSGIRKDMIGVEFYRWLYTAITRTKRRLYFINMPGEMIVGWEP